MSGKNRLNILIVSQYFWPENFRVNELAFELKKKGHKVTVLTGLPNYPKGQYFDGYGLFNKRYIETVNGVKICRVPLFRRGRGSGIRIFLNYMSFMAFASFLGPFMCKGTFDAIFVFEVSPVTVGFPAIIMKKVTKAPIFFWVLDLWPESVASAGGVRSKIVLNIIRKFVRYIYLNCDRILVSSKGYTKSIKKIEPRLKQIKYFPNFIEDTFGHQSLKEVDGIDFKFPEGFKVVFAGNIGEAQAFPTIVEAAKIINKDYKDIHWIILGDGRMAAWVRNQAAFYGLLSHFHMLGQHPQERMPYFFKHADAMLVSLKKEPIFELTIPGKIQSYLACGKPVIGALEGEGAQLIAEAQAGVSCKPENPTALAQAVLSLYKSDIKIREAMGRNGKNYCKKYFDRDTLVSLLENWFKNI